MKKNIAIVWGGYSSEKEVSEKSAQGIYSFIDKDNYNVYKVKIDDTEWSVEYSGSAVEIDKNDFSFVADGKRVVFDFTYITIHGTPGEDGVLQGYFDMLRVPYSNCGVLASALTFNKFICNNFLKPFGFNVAESMVLRPRDTYNVEYIADKIGLPLFVKPNAGGSSFATTKVKDISQLAKAIDDAFTESSEVIVESFIDGVEVTCGMYEGQEGLVVLPLTEVVTENEFFDYDAKYKGQVEEITPARISNSLTTEIQNLTRYIYRLIDAKGIIRADYIISDNVPVLLEVNTTPGMTATSFIPQQVASAGLDMKSVLTDIIELEYGKMSNLLTGK